MNLRIQFTDKSEENIQYCTRLFFPLFQFIYKNVYIVEGGWKKSNQSKILKELK